ncbi:hypothetical protein FQZ97_990880 [compost metagenome]
MDGHEVAYEGEAGEQRDGQPGQLLAAFAQQFGGAPGLGVQAHARAAVALQVALDPEEDLGVDRLRAGVAAPEPAGQGGEEEQRERREHQQRGQVDEVLGLQDQAKDVEMALLQVEQHGLAPVPGQPGHAVEHQLREPHHHPAPAREAARDRARVDLAGVLHHGEQHRLGSGRVGRWHGGGWK